MSHQQLNAEETFLAQPDRHPHRMVHYGHYLFRAPAPLAIFDPGIDKVTGQSIFLEGHRQNTVMFADAGASADLGGLVWLSPALIYQFFAPLLIILLGYNAIGRERESGTLGPILASAVTPRNLVFGKALALFWFASVLLVPLCASAAIALTNGESVTAFLFLVLTYLGYLSIWIVLTLLISSAVQATSSALATLTALWLTLSLVFPSIAINLVTESHPSDGKIETDLQMLADIRKLGDGHNANDKAFEQLRESVLLEYGVDKIEDLPVNFRGLVAYEGEEKLTGVLNEYAYMRMSEELEQENQYAVFGWLSPMVAARLASRSISGTDLTHYHRFQTEAEQVRYDFVQGLNRAHADLLSYKDDINRNKNEESRLRARVDSKNWQVLEQFKFDAAPVSERIASAKKSTLILLVWLVASTLLLFWRAGKIAP